MLSQRALSQTGISVTITVTHLPLTQGRKVWNIVLYYYDQKFT